MSQQSKLKFGCPECHDWGVLDNAEGVSRCSCRAGEMAAQEYIDCLVRLRQRREKDRLEVARDPRLMTPLKPITQADIDAVLAEKLAKESV